MDNLLSTSSAQAISLPVKATSSGGVTGQESANIISKDSVNNSDGPPRKKFRKLLTAISQELAFPIPGSVYRKKSKRPATIAISELCKRFFKFDTGYHVVMGVSGIEGYSISLRAWKDFYFSYPWIDILVIIDEQLDRPVSLPSAWVHLKTRKFLIFPLRDLISSIDGQDHSGATASYVTDIQKAFEARYALTKSKTLGRNGDRRKQWMELELGVLKCPVCNSKYQDTLIGRAAFIQHCKDNHGNLMPQGPGYPLPGCGAHRLKDQNSVNMHCDKHLSKLMGVKVSDVYTLAYLGKSLNGTDRPSSISITRMAESSLVSSTPLAEREDEEIEETQFDEDVSADLEKSRQLFIASVMPTPVVQPVQRTHSKRKSRNDGVDPDSLEDPEFWV
ncbi:hypothetical protein N431DRAFT_474751 [Stipitochalara longipes BDJ]|nr:hypothetical protein N431DRAFT_474751 [Stipitochalara longipes BDJ]